MLLLLVAWGVFAYASSGPPDFHTYRVTAVQTAQSAHDGLIVTALTATAQLDGRALAPYVSTMLDDAGESVGEAAARFAALSPTDEQTVAIRDELKPLLDQTVTRLGDVRRAEANDDMRALRTAVAPLRPLAERLTEFLDRHG